MSDLRLFVAVSLDEKVRNTLKRWMPELRHKLSFQKWVHPDDLHVTLKFLGSTPVQSKDRLAASLAELSAQLSSFPLRVGELGAFGKPAEPSVLQTSLSGDLTSLQALQKSVEHIAADHGFDPEKRAYKPHITLARRYKGAEPFRRHWLDEASPPADGDLSWAVKDFILYQSHLNRSPMYQVLGRFPLKDAVLQK